MENWNNNKVTSNKEAKKKLNGYITSYRKLINDFFAEVKLISAKVLTEDFINWCSILNGLKYFVKNVSQNYLLFQPVYDYIKIFINKIVMAWKSEVLSDESIKPPATPDNNFNLDLVNVLCKS